MPDYIVKGVDKDSGFDTELVVNAESPANAKVKAELQGLVVTMIDGKPVDSSVPSPPQETAAAAAPVDTGKPRTTSYIENNLIAGENIVYQAKLHPICLVFSIGFIIVGFLFLLPIFSLSMSKDSPALNPFCCCPAFVPLLVGTLSIIRYFTTEFAITNKRLLAKHGWISRKSFEIMLAKVESIQVNQGIIGRFIGAGTIVVIGSGGTKNTFRHISKPLDLRRAAQEQTDAAQK